MEKELSPLGTSWTEYSVGFLAPEEKAEIDLRVKIVGKLIEARNTQDLSQRDLAELTGVKQTAIARIEKCKNFPQINTLLKLLAPLGYTLDVVPVEK